MCDLMAYLSAIDPLERIRQSKDFDPAAYAAHLIEQVEKDNGAIFMAESNGEIVGCIAGCLATRIPADHLEVYPLKKKDGKILELVVSSDARGKGIGKLLMEKMEQYFITKECGAIQVECFGPNAHAHAFYERHGYADRLHVLIKKCRE